MKRTKIYTKASAMMVGEMRVNRMSVKTQKQVTGLSYSGLHKRIDKGTIQLNDFINICLALNIKPSSLLEKAEKYAEGDFINE